MALLAALSAGVSIVSGIAGLFGSGGADLKARQLASDQLATQRESLGFAMTQYEDWKKTYGVVEKQMSDYYVSSNGQMQMDAAANMIETSFRNVPTDINRIAEQRGLGEGQKAAMLSEALVSKAESKALGRINAGTQFRSEKAGFVASGQDAKGQATTGVLNSYNQMAQLLGQQYQAMQGQASSGSTAAGSAISSGIALLASGLGGGTSSASTSKMGTPL